MAERFGKYLLPLDPSKRGEVEDRRGAMPGVPPPLGMFRGKPVAPVDAFHFQKQPPPLEAQPAGQLEKDAGLPDLQAQENKRLLKGFREKQQDLPPPDIPMKGK